MNRLAWLALPLVLVTGCHRSASDCARSVDEFRTNLRTDPTLATVPDSAISLARAHRADTSVDCMVANRYADDAETARRNPPAPAPAARAAAGGAGLGPVGTPRVRLEITPTPGGSSPASQAPRGPRPYPLGEQPALDGAPAEAEASSAIPQSAPEESAASPEAAPASTTNAREACHKDCDSVANFQARVACNQRCDGATPLPGSTASPTIIH